MRLRRRNFYTGEEVRNGQILPYLTLEQKLDWVFRSGTARSTQLALTHLAFLCEPDWTVTVSPIVLARRMGNSRKETASLQLRRLKDAGLIEEAPRPLESARVNKRYRIRFDK